MKKKLTTILAMCLCAIMMVTAINPSTAYAADNYTKIKVKYNDGTATFKVNMDKKGIEKVKVKTLKKKWGKPDVTDKSELRDNYQWNKNEETRISFTDNYMDPRWGGVTVIAHDKAISVCGIKIGMKASKASKILKDLGFPMFEESDKPMYDNDDAYIQTGFDAYETVTIICGVKKGKVTSIECHLYRYAD